MSLPLSPLVSLSPSSISFAGQVVTATVSVKNRPSYTGKPSIPGLTTITPKIVCSRVPSGVTPFWLYFSASETTADAGNPYLDLDYRWSFGDTSGTELFTDQWNGKEVNANSDQIGPEASYLYRSAGSYTVTLTVTGKDENGTLISASTTEIITRGIYYVWLGLATGGTYTLTCNGQTTDPIAWNASTGQIGNALLALSNLDDTNCKIAYTKNVVEFIGDLAGESITFTGDFSGLTGVTGTPATRTEVPSATYSNVTVTSVTSWTTQYFDSNYAGDNGAPDGTITRPYTTIAQFSTFITGGNNRHAIVSDGTDWTLTANIKFNSARSGIRVSRTNTGSKPIIRGSTFGFLIENEWGSVSSPNKIAGDVIFSGLDLRGSVGHTMIRGYGSGNGTLSYPYSTFSDLALDQCDYTYSGISADVYLFSIVPANNGGRYISNIGMWGCTVDMGNAAKQAVFMGINQFFFVMGGSIEGGNGSLTLDHHFYTNMQNHSGLRWVRSGTGSKSYFFNGNVTDSSPPVKYYMIDGCYTGGVLRGFDFSNSNNDQNLSGKFDQVMLSYNDVANSQAGLLCNNLYRINIRGSVFRNNAAGAISSSDNVAPTTFSIFDNQFYSSIIAIIENQLGYFHNNYIHATSAQNSTWKVGLQYRDSTTSVELWDIDNNRWYCPDGTDTFFNRTTNTYSSFANWQSWGNDLNGSVGIIGWSDPVDGIMFAGVTTAANWPTGFSSLEYSIDNGDNWISYTNGANVSLGGIGLYTEILYKGIGPTSNGTHIVTVFSNGSSVDLIQESGSASLIATNLRKYFIINSAQNIILDYPNNGD